MFETAAILAGGQSSRMGFDKQLLMENDRRILEQVVETLREEFPDIIVVTSRPELYEGMGVRVCSDEYRGKGPLAGVHSALKHARSRYVYLLACDMPVVCLGFIRHMKQRILESGADVCVCEREGRLEPFNTFYSTELLPEIVHRLETGNSSLFRFINASSACVVTQADAARFDRGMDMFTNINTRSEYEKYLGAGEAENGAAAMIGKREIIRYIGGEFVQMRDLMVHEITLHLEINGAHGRTFYSSPGEARALVTGHLYTQGLIGGPGDIISLEIDEEAGRAAVCAVPQDKQTRQKAPAREIVFDPELLLANQQQFYDHSTLQKATAGTHRCALCDDGGTYFACVDISRHNCMDKLAGRALLAGVDLGDKYILTSGRIPLDMIRKAAAAGVPMIVSRSTPTIAAVEAAQAADITLLGFSRENRFNVYSAPHRLKGCAFSLPEDADS